MHLFTGARDALGDALVRYRVLLRPDAVVWVSWPKLVVRRELRRLADALDCRQKVAVSAEQQPSLLMIALAESGE